MPCLQTRYMSSNSSQKLQSLCIHVPDLDSCSQKQYSCHFKNCLYSMTYSTGRWKLANYRKAKKPQFTLLIAAFLVAQMVKNADKVYADKTQVWFLGWEIPLEKRMATHTSILAWKIPWTEEPGGLQPMSLQRVGHNWATNTRLTLELHFIAASGRKLTVKSKDESLSGQLSEEPEWTASPTHWRNTWHSVNAVRSTAYQRQGVSVSLFHFSSPALRNLCSRDETELN